MVSVVASAPGKLVVSGEYAVLEGGPAIVLALNRRARVRLSASDEGAYVIAAPEFGIPRAVGRLDARQRVQWSGVDARGSERLALVASVIESMLIDGAPSGFRAELDTGAFFSVDGGGHKFGLGSSAALTVALAGAICAEAGRDAPLAEPLMVAHRRMQGGRGSGLDIAASLTGGVIEYRRRGTQPKSVPVIVPVRWPDDLQFACVWSGKPASTGEFLQRLAVWQRREPARYGALMRELTAGAEAVASAFADHSANAVLSGISAYAASLERLGVASGLDIVSAEHRAIAGIAADSGVVYKSCGAGGGDIGIALTVDAERLRAFRARLAQAGLQTLDAQIALSGLEVH